MDLITSFAVVTSMALEESMQSRILTIVAFVICLVMSVSVFAQDPLSGNWRGDWGPSPGDRNPVTLVVKFDGKAVSGTINPDTDKVQIQKGTFDPKTGAVRMEAMAPGRGGRTFHYVIDGKLEKGTITGSWNHDNSKGDFKITKQ
jgi:hypothetical protein